MAMPKSSSLNRNSFLRITIPRQSSAPITFPEKRSKKVSSSSTRTEVTDDSQENPNISEHRIDIGAEDEQLDLLGRLVYSGKLILDKRNLNSKAVDAKLTSKALVWGSHILQLDDVVSVTYNSGVRHFTVHAYPIGKRSCGLSCIMKPKRSRRDLRFVAPTIEEAIQWVASFADQQCFINSFTEAPQEPIFMRKNPPKMLVVLNPCSGHGRASKVFHDLVEPIFKLAGFKLEAVKTTQAGHARELASTIDMSACPDGIICVGGDGIINEVLNGILSRSDRKERFSIPIGIIPAGSDNSLVWTVLGVRDPISAAISIVKGGLTAIDVFAVQWIQSGVIHFGTTVSYYGFVSDVLELSGRFQKWFGPLRYFVAGFLKLLCLPKYSYEVEYLPAHQVVEGRDTMRRSSKEGIMNRASSLPSIDSMMSPIRMSRSELDTCSSSGHASAEPSEFVRGIDPKAKRMSYIQSNVTAAAAAAEVIHPRLLLSATPNRPRPRSKSRIDKEEHEASTVSDPGPVWDGETAGRGVDNPMELPRPPSEDPRSENRWVSRKGQFLGILVCNHACRTVQSSQVVAPEAEHDDGTMDMILVHGRGRMRLMRFYVLLQLGRHLSLPYVECIKVRSVKISAGNETTTHNGCGIDGELFTLNGQVISFMLSRQFRLIGLHPMPRGP